MDHGIDVNHPCGFEPITLAAARALMENECADFALYLYGPSHDEPVLYRNTAASLSLPDFHRLCATGTSHLYVPREDFQRCAAILEGKLTELIADDRLDPEEKVRLLAHIGVYVARDLCGGPVSGSDYQRASQLVSVLVEFVLEEPLSCRSLLSFAVHHHSLAGHHFITAALSVVFGKEVFGPVREELLELGLAGMTHDLGKAGIDPELLSRPSPLSLEEQAVVYQHPVESVRLLGSNAAERPGVRRMILQHHEWLNGRGYPIGLSGDDLLPGSRVLAVVDTFHALLGRRPWRARMLPTDTARALDALAGRQLDCEMTDCWNRLVRGHWRMMRVGEPTAHVPGDPVLSTRHEHRPMDRTNRYFGPRSKRHAFSAPAAVNCYYARRLSKATDAADEFIAYAHDVSRSGLCLLTEHPMYRGEIVHVRLEQRSGHVWVRGEVAWCMPNRSGRADEEDNGAESRFRVGLRFIRRIAEHESHAPATETRTTGQSTFVATASGAPAAEKEHENADRAAVDATSGGNDGPDAENRAPRLQRSATTDSEAASENLSLPEAMQKLEAILTLRSIPLHPQRTAISLTHSPHAVVRRKAIEVLARIATREARTALLHLIRDEEPGVREHAAAVAGMLRMAEAEHLLRQTLSDPVVPVALRAAGALGRIGERDGLSLVQRHLVASGPYQRLAARALGEIVGHRFPANVEGIRAALRYMAARIPPSGRPVPKTRR